MERSFDLYSSLFVRLSVGKPIRFLLSVERLRVILRDDGISIIKYILSKAGETLNTLGFRVCAFA